MKLISFAQRTYELSVNKVNKTDYEVVEIWEGSRKLVYSTPILAHALDRFDYELEKFNKVIGSSVA